MRIRSSLRKKSIYALSLYLCFFIATIGSVAYLVVEPPVRSNIERNLDLRTELLASQIKSPFNRAVGVLNSLVGVAQSQQKGANQPHILGKSTLTTILNLAAITRKVGIYRSSICQKIASLGQTYTPTLTRKFR